MLGKSLILNLFTNILLWVFFVVKQFYRKHEAVKVRLRLGGQGDPTGFKQTPTICQLELKENSSKMISVLKEKRDSYGSHFL